jgi:regulator of protease activity HflC (stomatin/prohibitin superfamily)
MLPLSILAALVALGAITLGNSLRIVKQYERGVVFRLGRVSSEPKSPGMTAIIPFVDRLEKVNLQIVTMPIPAQEGITRDNVTVRVDAVIYFKVIDPRKAVVDVEDYQLAVGQVAQTSLRSIIGQSELDDLLTNRERLNQGLAIMIDSPAVDWGIHIDRVEIKDVALPETMKRSMSRQAEAERERRSRVIIADGELQASNNRPAAATPADHRRGRRRAQFDPGPALPRRAAALPRGQYPDRPCGRSVGFGDEYGIPRRGGRALTHECRVRCRRQLHRRGNRPTIRGRIVPDDRRRRGSVIRSRPAVRGCDGERLAADRPRCDRPGHVRIAQAHRTHARERTGHL